MLNRSGENGYSFLVPDLRGKALNILPLSMMLAVGLPKAFIMLKYVPSIPSVESFYCGDVQFLKKIILFIFGSVRS